MVIAKFNNIFLDNLIQFVSNSKFKEKESLNYLIIDRKLLIIIPIIFRKEPLITKSFKTIEEWQNYIDNEFKNFILKNNISKITINLNDKPDLIIMQNGEKIGVELTSVFPFLKDKKRGDIFKHHDDKQTKIKNNVVKKLMALNLEEKMPWIKIFENNNRVVFPKEFTNLKDKKLIEEAIGQVEKVEQIVPMTFIPNYFKCLCDKQEHNIETLKGFKSVIELIGKNSKNDLNINIIMN